MKSILSPRGLLTGLLLLFASGHLQAGIRPSFRLEATTWRATDIVVVTEGDVIDGNLNVVETWKGTLSPGDAVSIKELGEFATTESRTVKPPWSFKPEKEPPPVIVSGKKMVLFLRRSLTSPPDGTNKPVWEPASPFKDMNTSVVWVEGQAAYSFQQLMHPGPSELTVLNQPEARIKEIVGGLVHVQKTLDEVAAIPDAAKRAQQVAHLIESDGSFARSEALHILAGCQTHAVPYLRQMLVKSSKPHLTEELISALAAAGGPALGGEFTRMLEAELVYWKAKAPSLPVGWWNNLNLGQAELAELRNRYGKTLRILYGLQQMKSKESESAVRQFRDYWRSLPQLEDKSGLTQMSQACDGLLKALSSVQPSN